MCTNFIYYLMDCSHNVNTIDDIIKMCDERKPYKCVFGVVSTAKPTY